MRLGSLGLIKLWDWLWIVLVIWLLVRTTERLLISVGRGVIISLVLLIVAIMHHWLHGHSIGRLRVWHIKWGVWLNRCHLFISNWPTFDRRVSG